MLLTLLLDIAISIFTTILGILEGTEFTLLNSYKTVSDKCDLTWVNLSGVQLDWSLDDLPSNIDTIVARLLNIVLIYLFSIYISIIN